MAEKGDSDAGCKTLMLIGHGGYDKLQVQNLERPVPKEGEVRNLYPCKSLRKIVAIVQSPD